MRSEVWTSVQLCAHWIPSHRKKGPPMPNVESNPERSPDLAISRSAPKRITAAAAHIDASNWPLGTYALDYRVPLPDPSGIGVATNPNTGEILGYKWYVALKFGPDAASSGFTFSAIEVKYIGKWNSEHKITRLDIGPAQWQVDGSDVVFSGGGMQTVSDDNGEDPGPPRTKRPLRRSSTDLPITSGNLIRK